MYVNRVDVFCVILFSIIDRQIILNDMKILSSFVFVGFGAAKYKS